MSNASGPAEYSIAAVSKLTGISCHALRVWERRYGFPDPHRSASGHRRYRFDQVQMLRSVASLAREGEPLAELMARARVGELAPALVPEATASGPALAVAELVDRLVGGDMLAAESEYARLTADLSLADRLERVVEPGLVEAGERLFRAECLLGQERCASVFLRRKLLLLLDGAQRENREPTSTVVVGTVQGDRHEGGALLFCAALELAGIRTLYVGADMPVPAFHEAVVRWRPAALGLSFVLSRNINKRFSELARIREVPIFVGGRSILNYQGLARRHGLVPLPGPARVALGPFVAHLRDRAGVTPRGARGTRNSR